MHIAKAISENDLRLLLMLVMLLQHQEASIIWVTLVIRGSYTCSGPLAASSPKHLHPSVLPPDPKLCLPPKYPYMISKTFILPHRQKKISTHLKRQHHLFWCFGAFSNYTVWSTKKTRQDTGLGKATISHYLHFRGPPQTTNRSGLQDWI